MVSSAQSEGLSCSSSARRVTSMGMLDGASREAMDTGCALHTTVLVERRRKRAAGEPTFKAESGGEQTSTSKNRAMSAVLLSSSVRGRYDLDRQRLVL